MQSDLDISLKTARVLRVFLEDPSQSRYGYELTKLAGLPSGSLYPMLARLTTAGWLTRGREDIDPHAEGRPARTHYTLTEFGASAARAQLAALSEQFRPPERKADHG